MLLSCIVQDTLRHLRFYLLILSLYSIHSSWYTVLEERLQGRAKVVEYVRENKEVFDTLESMVYAKL